MKTEKEIKAKIKELEKITPLPWSVCEFPNGFKLEIVAHDGTVATVAGTSGTKLETEANASYLVHAANSFPALLESLEKSEQAMAALLSAAVMAPQAVVKHPPFLKGITLTDAALAGARSALTQAREVKG